MTSQKTRLPCDSRQIANHLITFANEHGDQISIMRLLKLAYMAHGWSLAIFDEPLVNDYVQAWKYGPVIPTIYYAFRPYGVYGLNKIPMIREQTLGEEVCELMKSVYGIYQKLSDRQLTQLTHILGGPWHKVYKPGKLGIVIPNDLISQHFKSKIERSENKTSHI